MADDKQTDMTISCLTHALTDAQQTIRAYDTKAQILGVLLTLAIGIANSTRVATYSGWPKTLLAVACVCGMVAILLVGRVLTPRRNLFEKIQKGNYTPSGSYFITDAASGPQHSVPAMASRALETDWVSELTYETMKLSLIRDSKHWWFRWALWACVLTILLVAFAVGLADLCDVK